MQHKILSLSGIQPVGLKYLSSIFSILVLAGISVTYGQAPAVAPSSSSQPAPLIKPAGKASLERKFFKNILKDQGAIWTSPFRLKKAELNWLVPLTAGTATLIATDRHTAGALNNNRTRINFSLNISRFGSAYTAGGAALTFYAVGKITGNQRAKETGLLAGEALINSGIVVQALKFATQRPRPLERNGSGTFFTGGDSLPSGHAATVWSLAAVIDGEYGKRHPVVRYGAYGLATAVSLSRYTARRHFLSDVLVGSAIGYGSGRYTFLRHHDAALETSNKTKQTSKLDRYFPLITPHYNARRKIYGANLSWNL